MSIRHQHSRDPTTIFTIVIRVLRHSGAIFGVQISYPSGETREREKTPEKPVPTEASHLYSTRRGPQQGEEEKTGNKIRSEKRKRNARRTIYFSRRVYT